MLRHVQTKPLRYWRQIVVPELPWKPWGLLTLGALVLLYLLGAIWVYQAEQATVSAQGAPSPSAKAPQQRRQPSQNAQASTRHHDLVLTKVGERLILRGEVSDTAHRSSLLAAARAQFSSVDDHLRDTEQRAHEQDRFAATEALGLLALMKRGQVIWSQGVLSTSGIVEPDQERPVRARFAAIAEALDTDGLNLRVDQTAQRCTQQFSDALARSTINFATGAASIDNSSSALLKELADLASDCPGQWVIEGHTDNIGRPRFNRQLSLARAQAVRDALVEMGVSAERLSAQGLGASQPIADNASRSGRAKNRRIVIRSASTD